jgi:glycosyltransferase involved in cell wall biosynthesis
MKSALVIVAHPDDEILWFGGTILLHQDLAWTAACVTYNTQTPRGKDFLRVCGQIHARGILLGMEDAYNALLNEEVLENKLCQLLKKQQWHVVLTHNPSGEYGHPHHRQVCRIVKKFWKKSFQSGFGAQNINGLVRLPPAIFSRKRELFDFYQSAGKNERMKLYPPYQVDFEPLVTTGNIPLKAVEKIHPPTTWKQLTGLRDRACRNTRHVYKIALLADTKNWAHHIIATYLKRYLPPGFDVDIFYLFNEDYSQPIPCTFNGDDYHIIHLMSWRHWEKIKHYRYSPHKLVTTIHGHRGIDKDNQHIFPEIMQHFAAVSTVSQKLFKELSRLLPMVRLTPCGVDTQVFYPGSRQGDKPFTYGAVGRYYVETNGHDDIKGWKLILEPLALEMSPQKAKYIQVDKAAKIPYEAMPDFYRECHCYICSSKSEGNPLPLLEAASCGLALLSTGVGIAPEIIEEGQNGMILPRKKHAFAKAIKDLSNSKTRCNEMGKHSRKIILSHRDWWFVTKKWAEFYQSVL